MPNTASTFFDSRIHKQQTGLRWRQTLLQRRQTLLHLLQTLCRRDRLFPVGNSRFAGVTDALRFVTNALQSATDGLQWRQTVCIVRQPLGNRQQTDNKRFTVSDKQVVFNNYS